LTVYEKYQMDSEDWSTVVTVGDDCFSYEKKVKYLFNDTINCQVDKLTMVGE
jgi:hypothetical protein